MADFNQPSDLVAYFRDTIVALHSELSVFIYGDHEQLQAAMKKSIEKDDYILFLEWPEKRYDDDGGSIVARLEPSISILKAINKQDFAAQNNTIDKCYEILNDVIIRMRQEKFEDGHIFRIAEMGRVKPVYHMLIDNAFGVRVQIPMGDWVSTGNDVSKWSDLS